MFTDITTTTARRFAFLDMTGITVTEDRTIPNWAATATREDGTTFPVMGCSSDLSTIVHRSVATVRAHGAIGVPVTVAIFSHNDVR